MIVCLPLLRWDPVLLFSNIGVTASPFFGIVPHRMCQTCTFKVAPSSAAFYELSSTGAICFRSVVLKSSMDNSTTGALALDSDVVADIEVGLVVFLWTFVCMRSSFPEFPLWWSARWVLWQLRLFGGLGGVVFGFYFLGFLVNGVEG